MALNIKPVDKKPLTAYQTDALGGLDPSMFANDPAATPFGQHSVAAPTAGTYTPTSQYDPNNPAGPNAGYKMAAVQPGSGKLTKQAGLGTKILNTAADVFNNPVTNPVQYAIDQGTKFVGDKTGLPGISGNPINQLATLGGTVQTGTNFVKDPKGTTKGLAQGIKDSPVTNPIMYAAEQAGLPDWLTSLGSIPGMIDTGVDAADGILGGDLQIPGFGGGGTGTPLSGVVGGGGGNAAGRASAEAQRGNIDSLLQGITSGSVMPGTSDATQRGVLNQAQSFQPLANTSSANQQGVLSQAQNFRPQNAQNALSSVQGFNPTGTQGALNQVNALDPTQGGAFAQQQVDAFGNSVRPQTDVMGRTKAFQPMSADELLAELEQFRTKQEGPSKAEILLSQANDDAMSNALSLARSGRGSVGDQSRALQTAIGENAATSIDNARNMSLLRAEEEQQFRNQVMQSLGLSGDISGAADNANLNALGIEGNLASSLDEGTLKALGLSTQLGLGMDQSRIQKAGLQADLGKSLDDSTLRALGLETQLGLGMDSSLLQALGIQSDTANAMRSADVTERGQSMDATLRALGISADTANSMRNAGVTERGQSLGALTSLTGTSAGLTGDILSSDTQLGVAGMNNANQNARLERELQYKLTPQQQLLLAAAGAGGDILSKFIG